jgi:nucleoside-diphosphate-sugar epimerase
MKILITASDCEVARSAISALSSSHECIAVALDQADFRDEAVARSYVKDVDAVLHFAPIHPAVTAHKQALDIATQSTYRLAHAAAQANVRRMVLASTLHVFDAIPAHYRVSPTWRPRPLPTIDQLCAWLCELTLRECSRELNRTHPFYVACVRLGNATQNELRVELTAALNFEADGWCIKHIGQRPQPTAPAPSRPSIQQRPIHKVAIFGSGGPLASITAQILQNDYALLQTDVRPLADILHENKPQSKGAPLPILLKSPHQERVVDVTQYEEVMTASAGMDAMINCTVIRHHIANSFTVNVVGAYNVMCAAVAHGIKRVVHTGPFMVGQKGMAGYGWDHYLTDDIPPRPGDSMVSYLITKMLGQEIVRIFSEYYDLEVPTLVFCWFENPDNPSHTHRDLHPMTVSWRDAGRAMRAAIEVPSLPSPYEYIHINSDMPHGVYPNDKAKRLLGWRPLDDFSAWWT